MGRYLNGPLVPTRTAADRKKLIGKFIRYLRGCDIDKTGRGYFFPRVDQVVDAKGVYLILESGVSLTRGDLVEVELVELEDRE